MCISSNAAESVHMCVLQVIDVVHSHGGDVIKFAGDAMIIAFCPSQNEQSLGDQGYRNAVLRCAVCAEEVRNTSQLFRHCLVRVHGLCTQRKNPATGWQL